MPHLRDKFVDGFLRFFHVFLLDALGNVHSDVDVERPIFGNADFPLPLNVICTFPCEGGWVVIALYTLDYLESILNLPVDCKVVRLSLMALPNAWETSSEVSYVCLS